jgi:hypothetical protein
MANQRLIVVVIACLSLGTLEGTLMPPQHIPMNPPDPMRLRGLTDEESTEVLRRYFEDYHMQERIAKYEYLAEMTRQAMKNELRVNEAQWRIIEPKYERQIQVMCDTWARSSSTGHQWIKPTEYKLGRPRPLTFEELTEAYRDVDKLVDLLRREDTTEEELRKQIDALQQAREKARKEWPKAKQELAATLTTPRQEAVLLLMGYID